MSRQISCHNGWKRTTFVLLWIEQKVVSYDSLANLDLWIRNFQWNRYQSPVHSLGLDTYATFSTGDEAALVVVGHCLILQKSMDSTSAETRVSYFLTLYYVPQYRGIVTQLKSDRQSQWDITPSKNKQQVVYIN